VRDFLGIDHLDIRVSSITAVEDFYDKFMRLLGLSIKTRSHVGADGEWTTIARDRPCNVIEYHEPVSGEWRPESFVGLIEDDASMKATRTRVAFAVADPSQVRAWEPLLRTFGAQAIEFAEDFAAYPAVFFEDPVGTRLELCARLRKAPAISS